MIKGIETLAKDFYENKEICTEQKMLKMGQEVYIIDPTLVDEENDFFALIHCVVIGSEPSRFTGRWYYYFKATDDNKIASSQLNVNADREYGWYYKFLECTSPYIFEYTELNAENKNGS
jgi:hypothetical protein